MPRSSPLVSVVVPLYNYAQYLRNTVESVLDQGYRNIELIVVENGSTDDSREVLRKTAAELNDDRLVILEIDENQGPVPAWQRGFERATGDYFALLPADDYFLPGKIETQVAFLESHPEVDVVGTFIVQVDENGERCAGDRAFENLVNQENDLNDLRHWILGHQLSIPTALYRKKLCDAAGTPTRGLNHICDWEFHMRLIGQGARFALLSEPLTAYRWHPKNLSHSGPSEAIAQWAWCYATLLEPYLERTGQPEHAATAVRRFLNEYLPLIEEKPLHEKTAIVKELFHPGDYQDYESFLAHVKSFEPQSVDDHAIAGLIEVLEQSREPVATLRRVKRNLWVRLGRALGLVKKIRLP